MVRAPVSLSARSLISIWCCLRLFIGRGGLLSVSCQRRSQTLASYGVCSGHGSGRAVDLMRSFPKHRNAGGTTSPAVPGVEAQTMPIGSWRLRRSRAAAPMRPKPDASITHVDVSGTSLTRPTTICCEASALAYQPSPTQPGRARAPACRCWRTSQQAGRPSRFQSVRSDWRTSTPRHTPNPKSPPGPRLQNRNAGR
jgi:hypothetical protein